MKNIFTAKLILALALAGFVILGTNTLTTHKEGLQLKTIELKDTTAELNLLEKKYDDLNIQLEQKQGNTEALEAEKAKLEAEKQELQRQLQAKRAEQERLASLKTTARASAATKPQTAARPQVSGNKQTWLAASGIPESQWWAVDSIVSRESGWNPNAVNKTSGACGLGQQLPCGKWPGAWNDPVAALRAQYSYVVARYGGYPQAVAFWNANHWY